MHQVVAAEHTHRWHTANRQKHTHTQMIIALNGNYVLYQTGSFSTHFLHMVSFVWQTFNTTVQLCEKGIELAKKYIELEMKDGLDCLSNNCTLVKFRAKYHYTCAVSAACSPNSMFGIGVLMS